MGSDIVCRICEKDTERLLNYDCANTDFEVTLDQENILSIAYCDNESDFIDYVQIHISYCPECGRKLGED